jgi:aminocarboxymuconate-semialdehyde decarboxylase
MERMSTPRQPVIDFHAHVVVPEVYAVTKAHSLFSRAIEEPGVSEELKQATAKRNDAVAGKMAEVTERIGNMDAMGIQTQVLTASLVHQSTDFAEPEAALALDRKSNDRIAAIVASNRSRFAALGTVPLHAPELAAAELQRCLRQLGFAGVTISTQARDMEIGDRRLRPFWAKAEELGAVVYIHPAGNQGERFRKFALWNSVGQAMEETFAIASLFYEGILDAYPKLKIVISHGGGYMPYYTGRIDRNYADKPATRINMSKAPADYLRMLHYDTCVYDDSVLERLVEKVGADRIVLGSDYPVGDPASVAFVRRCRTLNEAQQEQVLWKNAAQLLGLRS